MTQTGAPTGRASALRSASPTKKKRRRVSLTPYLYLTPAIVFLGLVFAYPFVEIVRSSFLVPSATGDQTLGTANQKYLLGDQVFKQSIMHTLIFTPYILAVPVVGTTFIYLYSTSGIVNEILRSTGAGFLAQDWLGNPKLVLPSIMSVIIYRELGFGVVLFLARMMSIPGELLEAAKLDGANWYRMHRHVTIPQLRSVIEFFVVVEIMTMLSWVFAYVYTMTGGGPGFASVIMEFYIWQNAFEFQSPAIASALAVLLLVAVSGLVFLQHRLRRRSESVDDV